MTEAAVFFVSYCMLVAEETLISLPVQSDQSKILIIEEISIHFEEVKMVYLEDKLKLINMRIVKEKSKNLFRNSSLVIKEIMFDLYRSPNNCNLKSTRPRSFDRFTVINNEIELLEIPNTSKLKKYIEEEYFKTGEVLNLGPTGWMFEDGLKQSQCLRFLSSFAPKISIQVDTESKEVLLIQIYD